MIPKQGKPALLTPADEDRALNMSYEFLKAACHLGVTIKTAGVYESALKSKVERLIRENHKLTRIVPTPTISDLNPDL